MDSATLEALKGSIEKWERIVDGTGVDDGPDNCPLCEMFLLTKDRKIKLDDRCVGCPVYAATGQTSCMGTPYTTYSTAEERLLDNEEDEEESGAAADDMESAAIEEVEFLKSLLPKEEQNG